MQILPVKTRIMQPPKDDIYALLDEHLPKLCERDIVFITSKILAVHQGKCIPVDSIDKHDLIKREADKYLAIENHPAISHPYLLTIKDSTLIPASGIDESNANGYYITYPEHTDQLLAEIRSYLCKKYNLKELGVVATDSHTTPLRLGITGISTGIAGVNPIYDYRGAEDLFGRIMKISTVNIVDSLASLAVFIMGEGTEQTPIVIIRDVEKAEFGENFSSKDFYIAPEEDIYAPLLKIFE